MAIFRLPPQPQQPRPHVVQEGTVPADPPPISHALRKAAAVAVVLTNWQSTPPPPQLARHVPIESAIPADTPPFAHRNRHASTTLLVASWSPPPWPRQPRVTVPIPEVVAADAPPIRPTGRTLNSILAQWQQGPPLRLRRPSWVQLPPEVAVEDFPFLFFVNNLLDGGGAVTLTSNVTNQKPLANMQHTSKRKVWQGAGTSATVTIDLGAAQVVDSLLLTHENFSPTATIEWRYSSDNFATEDVSAGVLTVGSKPAGFDLVFPLLLFTTVTRRYWRLLLTDGSNPDGFLQIGRLYIGRRTGFTAGIIHPLKFAAVDSSQVSRNTAGDPLRHERAKWRRVSFAVSPFTDAVEAHQTFSDLYMQVGLSSDFFISLSPQASEAVQRRHTMYGSFSQIEGLGEHDRTLFIPLQLVFEES